MWLTVKLIKPWGDKPIGTLCRLKAATAESLIAVGTAELCVKPKVPKPKAVSKSVSTSVASKVFGKKPVKDDEDDG